MVSGGARLIGQMADIEKGVDEVAALVPFVVDPDELGDALCETVRLRAKFDAMVAQLTVAASASGVQFGAKQRSIDQYVASRTNADPYPVRRALTSGRWLRDFEVFADAYAAGDLSESHLRVLRLKLDGPRSRVALVGAQQILVDAARDCSFADFNKAAEYWLVHVDPDGDEPQDQVDKSRLSLRVGRGGRTVLAGEVDAVNGAAIRAGVEAEAERLRQADLGAGVVRGNGQRHMAALKNLIERGAARDDGTFSKPLINIVMSQAVAEWLLVNARGCDGGAGGSDRVPVDPFDVDGRCELIDGTPVHPHLVLATVGVATLRRCVLSADSRVVDVSVDARVFPEWMKTAIQVQARGGCETPGCDAPSAWLQADHVEPHSRGGPTAMANGQNLCRPDNRHKSDTAGHSAWRNRKPPPRHQRANHSGPKSDRSKSDNEDDDADSPT